jgi:NADPH:quinone reductase-like Zn-dependent oxidoreductase
VRPSSRSPHAASTTTDLPYRDGEVNDEFASLLGHEAAGTVEVVGAGVTEVAPGDFVILNCRAVCGQRWPGATGRSFSDFPTIVDSIRTKLLTLPPETVVHTGHRDDTTIGDEAPHLQEWLARGH